MANVKISALPAVTTVVPGSDVLPLVSGGITTKATPNAVVQAVLPSPGAIGGTTPAAITGTTITANTGFVGSLNGSVGASIPNTGAFTTLSASSTVSGTGFSNYLASPPAIGGTTAAAGTFTNLAYTGTLTGSTGVINIGSGQIYKDASGNVGIGTSSPTYTLQSNSGANTTTARLQANAGVNPTLSYLRGVTDVAQVTGVFDGLNLNGYQAVSFSTGSTEAMRITSAGYLGIGTSSPSYQLSVVGSTGNVAQIVNGSGKALNFYSASTYAGIYDAAGSLGNGITFNTASNQVQLQTNGTNTLTYDASGNLGLGVTPSGWSGYGVPVLQLSNDGTIVSNNSNQLLGANLYYSSGYKYIASQAASYYYQNAGAHKWYTAPSGTAGTAISFTQPMTLFASGSLALGYTSDLLPQQGNLLLNGASGTSNGPVVGFAQNGSVIGGVGQLSRITGGGTSQDIFIQSQGASNNVGLNANPSGAYIYFQTQGTERARIDSSGNLLVGCTDTTQTNAGIRNWINKSSRSGYNALTVSGVETSNTYSTYDVYSSGAAAYRFYVGYGGTVYATSTTISAISDQRLKENIVDLDVGLDAILALKPRKFDWKEGKGKDIKGDRGFIAQEFEQVFPDLIDEWKDPAPEGEEPYKSVRPDLGPILVKAIQELHAEIAALKAQLH